MAPGVNIYNSNNNPWMNLASDCFGFGNTNSLGFGGLTGLNGGIGYNGGIFTNCYGETNFNAVLGYQIFNVVGNIAGCIVSDINSNKVDNRAEIKIVDSQIIEKKTEINKLEKEKASLETKLQEAKDKRTSLDTEAANTKQAYDTAKTAYDNALNIVVGTTENPETKAPYTQAEKDALVKKLQGEMDAAKKAYDEANKLKVANDNILDEYPGKIETLENDIETAKGKLKELEGDRETQYNELSDKDKAKYCMTRFVTSERNVSNAKTNEEKAEAQKDRYIEAERLVTLYESSDKAKKEIPEIMYNAAKDYIAEHPELKAK